MNNRTIEATILGVDFYIETYPVDGWQINLADANGNDLYHKRVIADSLYEAITGAVSEVWAADIEKYQDYELPARIAEALGIEEPADEEELTDGEVLDRIYEVVDDTLLPEHEKLGYVRQLLEHYRTA